MNVHFCWHCELFYLSSPPKDSSGRWLPTSGNSHLLGDGFLPRTGLQGASGGAYMSRRTMGAATLRVLGCQLTPPPSPRGPPANN